MRKMPQFCLSLCYVTSSHIEASCSCWYEPARDLSTVGILCRSHSIRPRPSHAEGQPATSRGAAARLRSSPFPLSPSTSHSTTSTTAWICHRCESSRRARPGNLHQTCCPNCCLPPHCFRICLFTQIHRSCYATRASSCRVTWQGASSSWGQGMAPHHRLLESCLKRGLI